MLGSDRRPARGRPFFPDGDATSLYGAAVAVGAAGVGRAPAVTAEVVIGSFQRTLAMALILALGPAFMPLGCGGSGGRFSPVASVQRAAEVPPGVAQELRTCTLEHKAHLGLSRHSVSFDVKLANDGQVDAVTLRASTFADEDLEACMAHALRSLSEDDLLLRRSENLPRGPLAPQARALLGQAEEALAVCVAEPPCLLALTIFAGAYIIGVQIHVYVATHPGTRTHPAKPQVQDPTKPDKDPKAGGAPTTTGSTPPIPPQPPDCPRNESFTPEHTDNATGCIDKKGSLRCYVGRHFPCAGVHTHGRLRYQEIRNGICKEADKEDVRCEGPFNISGPCGSVSTVGCRDGGPEMLAIDLLTESESVARLPDGWKLLGHDLSDKTRTSSLHNCAPWEGQLEPLTRRVNDVGLLSLADAELARKLLPIEWGEHDHHAHVTIWALYERE